MRKLDTERMLIGLLLFSFVSTACQSPEQQVKSSAGPEKTTAAAAKTETGEPGKSDRSGPMPAESLFAERVVFTDTFEDNRHQWPVKDNQTVEAEIGSGRYTLSHKPKSGIGMETVNVVFEEHEDFSIAATVSRSGGPSESGYGLVWGARTHKNGTANFYSFMLSGAGRYRVAKTTDKWHSLISWKASEHIKTGYSKNKIAVRKTGSQYGFYINDQKVGTTNSVGSFFGSEIGFIVTRNSKVRADDITITAKRTIPQIYEVIKAEADKGSPYHMALLGDAYRRGYPVKEDDPKGEKLIRAAAEKDHPFGLFELAQLYDGGEDFEHDKEKAESLFKAAYPGIRSLAEAGDAFAQDYLGDMYYYGQGTEKDFKQAKTWYDKASAQGHFSARTLLGVLYARGDGVPKDYDKAFRYFLKEARKGYYVAQYDVGVFYDNGMGVKQDRKTAKIWYEKAIAVKDYDRAINNLARFYQWGYAGVKIDPAKAREMYKKAAEKDNTKAPVNYAKMVRDGKGGPKDEAEAVKWFRKGAQRGDARGMREMAAYFMKGDIVDKDPAKGIIYAYFAAEEKDGKYQKTLHKYDAECGLLLPVRLTWNGDKKLEENSELDELMQRVVKGYQAGMTDIGHSLFRQAMALDAEMLYKDNVWATIFARKLPMSLTSELLLALKETMQERPDYWFFFAHGAILARQPALALPAVERMEAAMARNPENKAAKGLESMPGLLKAAAMVQMGQAEAAYKTLFAAGKPDASDPALVHFINFWLRPLLKDKKKFAFVMDIDEQALTQGFALYSQQSFHHPLSGKLIKAVTAAPKLETQPKPEAPQQPRQAPPPARSDTPKPADAPQPAPKAKIID